MLWVAFLVWGRYLTDATWARILPGFERAESAETGFGPTPPGHIPWILGWFLVLLTSVWAGVWLFVHFQARFLNAGVRRRLFSNAIGVAVCAGLFICWVQVPETPFGSYTIKTMMTDPGSVPVFGQRLLLVWPAVLLKHFVPRLSYFVAFKSVQGAAIVVAVYLIGKWSALFVGDLKFLGQIVSAAYLIPTFAYPNAHDVGVLIIYTLCFIFLYRRNYWLFGVTFCVGMLNHQNTLLLIPTALVILWGREKRAQTVWLVLLTTAAYFSIQFALNWLLPIPATHYQKIWTNVRQIVEMHRTLLFGFLALAPWYAAGVVAFSDAEPFLQRAAILLPMQLGVFFVYGQLNEARIFNGFLPVLIGILLCYVRSNFSLMPNTLVESQQNQVGYSVFPAKRAL